MAAPATPKLKKSINTKSPNMFPTQESIEILSAKELFPIEFKTYTELQLKEKEIKPDM